MSHTPGPWEVVTAGGYDTGPIFGIAPTGSNRWVSRSVPQKEREFMEDLANANLIAAAPELLEDLKVLLNAVSSGRISLIEYMSENSDRIDAVVAKAEGKL